MRFLLATLYVIGLLISSQALASDQQLLTSKMDAFLVTLNDEGKEKFSSAEEVKPNDIIEYKLTYNNVSERPLSGLTITGPIPMNTYYVGDTNKTEISAKFLVSIDGGNTFEAEPVKRIIKKDGEDVEVVIPPEKYTTVQWIPNSPINSQEEQVFTYRIQVK